MKMLNTRYWLSIVFLLLTGITIIAPAFGAPPQPKINWSPCYRDIGQFDCGTVQVPLDYENSNSASISIALIRLPAGDATRKIGSLFLNPGGPGGSGINFALQVAPLLSAHEIGLRFDIVGFDPRGTHRSTALRCFGNTKQYIAIQPPFVFPVTPEEEAMQQVSDEALVAACEQRAGRIIEHMTTADVARDLDLLREAVDDEQLNYLGISYGSYLGVTYANLFPDKVRAVVVDSVLDPRAWATGVYNEGESTPLPSRLRSDASAEATLAEFFRLCDAGEANCAFAPNSAARFKQLSDKLKIAPIEVSMPDGSALVVSYDEFIGYILSSLYFSDTWPETAELLAAVEAFSNSAKIGLRLQALREQLGLITKRGFPNYANAEAQAAITCSDSDNPHSFPVWIDAAHDADLHYPNFGLIWNWLWGTCASWPDPSISRYAGPFDAATANPVLVVSSRFDPATPYEGAVAVHNNMPNTALLTVDGWGHGAILMSQCALLAELNYIINGTTPPEGTVCPPDKVPFSDSFVTATQSLTIPRSVVADSLLPEYLKQRLY